MNTYMVWYVDAAGDYHCKAAYGATWMRAWSVTVTNTLLQLVDPEDMPAILLKVERLDSDKSEVVFESDYDALRYFYEQSEMAIEEDSSADSSDRDGSRRIRRDADPELPGAQLEGPDNRAAA